MKPLAALVLAVLLALTAASAVALVAARHDARRAFIALSTLERERDELNVEYGRLSLERATWADANRVEKIAVGELGMVFPAPTATEVIRR